MEVLSSLALGFETALQPELLLFCLIGVTLGTAVGAIPGIGPLVTISMLLPVTFYLTPEAAIIMLAGVYYGGHYGGSIASILLNLPGTASSAVICLDGYPMAQQGRAGVALFVTAVASFIGGTIGIVALILFAPLLVKIAFLFSAAEYFSLMLLGLVAASTISIGSPLKGLAMVVAGLILGSVGTDVGSGQYRFTFGQLGLVDGVSLIALAMGLFGVAEILANVGGNQHRTIRSKVTWRSLVPTREDVRRSFKPVLRGSVIGTICGALPGAGTSIASFMAYGVEKKVSRTPERFGKGTIEGVTAPEAANNGAAQAAFIPTLSLGIPGDVVMALLLGALMIHGITPGPRIVATHPELFWGLVASFWVGNVMLLVLNIPLIGIWVRLLTIPYRFLYPTILFFICIGVYSVNTQVFDVYLVIIFGVVGYFMRLAKLPAAPLLLGFILAAPMERNLRRALLISGGDFWVFVQRPISAGLLLMVVVLLALSFWAAFRRRQRTAGS